MLIAYLYRMPVHTSICLYEFVVNFVSVSLVKFGILLYYPYIARPCLAGRRFLRPPTPPAAAVEATRREARRALHILPEARKARRRLRARRAWRCVPRPASPDLCLAPPRPSPLRRAPVHRTLPPQGAHLQILKCVSRYLIYQQPAMHRLILRLVHFLSRDIFSIPKEYASMICTDGFQTRNGQQWEDN